MRSVAVAVLRSIALAAVALAATPVAAITLVALTLVFGLGLVIVLPPVVVFDRKYANTLRSLASRWCGVDVPRPYRTEPAPPVRRPDGLYEADNRLHRHAWWPRMSARIGWALGDRATGKDLLFLLLHPVVGVGLAGLPLAALGVAIGGLVSGAWPLVAAIVVVPTAPVLLKAYGQWCRVMLGTVSPRRQASIDARKLWWGTRLVALVRLGALGASGVLAALAGLYNLIGLTAGIGFVFLFAPSTSSLRRVADLRRHLANVWSGVPVASLYTTPRSLDLEPDGRYRVGKSLFKTERWARWAERQDRLLKDNATWRDLGWALAEPATGMVIALLPIAAIVAAVLELIAPGVARAFGDEDGLFRAAPVWLAAIGIAAGIAAGIFAVHLAPRFVRWHGQWTAVLLAPTRGAELAQRVEHLTETRSDAVAAQAAEVRRIERDLHDGAQARLVALGLALGNAERLVDTDPEAAKRLVTQAREASSTALAEIRDVVRGIHPPVLAERGLGDAVRALALDTPMPVDVTVDLPGRAAEAVESAAYFAVAEALANVVKHARASRIEVNLRWADGVLRLTVRDDGRGGADPRRGTGLAGLTRRLGTFDGSLTVDSPPGGPTVLTMELPCVLSSPKTSPC
ncbi:MAG TPA: sensor histidine kinase [Micromonosporaceae bacterium]|nr:sensor histidine kinase [Micromonosporaceae bacterium]